MKRKTNFKKRIGENKILFCLVGFFAFFSYMILLSLIASGILVGLEDPTAQSQKAALVVLILCGAVGGITIRGLRGDYSILTAILPAFLSAAVMFCVSLICNGSLSPKSLMNGLCFLMTACFFTLCGKKKKKSRRHR